MANWLKKLLSYVMKRARTQWGPGFPINQMQKKYLFLVIPILLLIWGLTQAKRTSLRYLDQHGKIHVLSLSVKDRERLLGFMEKLFAEDNFAYTLLGSKPISWASYHAPFPYINSSILLDSLKKHSCTLHLGWKTWEKYHDLFPSSTFF